MHKIFLGSSVVLAALFSETGGSFRLFKESNENKLELFINHYVLEEITDVIKRKKPTKLKELPELLSFSNTIIQSRPNIKLVKQVLNIIHPKDAVILAGAIQAKADFLITLYRKDFFTPKLQKVNLPFTISIPQEFFRNYFV